MDVCDGRVDDGRFGGAPDLRKVWKKCGQVLEKKRKEKKDKEENGIIKDGRTRKRLFKVSRR